MTTKYICIWLGLALMLIVASPAETATTSKPSGEPDFMSMDIDQLTTIPVDKVYAASKREQSLSDAPSSVSIVTAQDIRENGYRTLTDVLNSVRGFYVTYNRNYGFVGVRGFNRDGDYGGRNLLLVDGHRMNEPIFDSVLVGNEAIVDVDLIDRVEIVRGPGSALYGNNAFFSVINVITKGGRDLNWAEGSVEVGGYETYKGRFTLGHQFTNGVEAMFSGTYLESAGDTRYYDRYFDDGNPANNGGVAENVDYERASSFFTKWSYGDFTLEGAYSSREKGVPTGTVGTRFNDPRTQTTDDQAFADLKFQRVFAGDLTVLARGSYHRYAYDAVLPYDYGGTNNPADFVINIDEARSQTAGVEVQVSKPLLDRHVITAGGEFRSAFEEFYGNHDVAPYALYTDVDRSDYLWGLFINGEFELYRTNLTLHAGVRYDGFSDYDPAVNPRAAIVGKPWNGTTLKFLYGEAYRTPNVFEKYWITPVSKASPDLEPETTRSYEAVWEQKLGRYFSGSLSAFYNEIDDLVTQDVDSNDGLIYSLNGDQAHAIGAEVELEGHHKSGLRGRISYAGSEARDEQTDAWLSNSPRHLAKLNLSAPVYADKVIAALEVRYTGETKTFLGDEVNDAWLVNATLLTHNIVKGLEVSASIYNLLDTDYYHPVGAEVASALVRQDGRSFRVKLTYRF